MEIHSVDTSGRQADVGSVTDDVKLTRVKDSNGNCNMIRAFRSDKEVSRAVRNGLEWIVLLEDPEFDATYKIQIDNSGQLTVKTRTEILLDVEMLVLRQIFGRDARL